MSSRSMKRAGVQAWTLADSYSFIATFSRRHYATSTAGAVSHSSSSSSNVEPPHHQAARQAPRHPTRRHFHDYFVTHLPVSSLHPDSRASPGPHHKLPRSASLPYDPDTAPGPSPATIQTQVGVSRETTVVRIPLRSAKHHFGASAARGTRKTNEDTYQAGVIELPAFAKRAPLSVTIGKEIERQEESDGGGGGGGRRGLEGNQVADSVTGDPQVFYFGIFDGHGGSVCSEFLRDELHEYVQDAAAAFELQSSLKKGAKRDYSGRLGRARGDNSNPGEEDTSAPNLSAGGHVSRDSISATLPIIQGANRQRIGELERRLVSGWKGLVGGYFRRFKPSTFSYFGDNSELQGGEVTEAWEKSTGAAMEEVLEYAFLKADFDFVAAQASKQNDDLVMAEKPLNEQDILHSPSNARKANIGGPTSFKGGSTSSIAMISTPTPTPFWHPAAPASVLVSHVGDTRILLCSTSTGLAIPLTMDHHPSSPIEENRLLRYATTFVTDSFGEERIDGLANTRAFGDIQSKRIGVSAEPEIRRIEMRPAEYSFMVLMTDGVSGSLPDQEVADIVKEARTPDQGARDVVSFATEVSRNGDNATCLVIRLGGWERRQEGGLGSMGTKEDRSWRKQEASNPRTRRQ